MNPALPIFDKQTVAARFSQAAGTYDSVAEVQRSAGEWLLKAIHHQQTLTDALDAGCGSGAMTVQLAARLPAADINAIDISHGMLDMAVTTHEHPRVNYYEGDIEDIPFEAKGFDLVYSNFVLQWCPQPVKALTEMRRVLRRGGQLVLAMPGVGTLAELSAAWRAADNHAHIHPFASEDMLATMVEEAGFAHAELNTRTLRVHVPDAMTLMRNLKTLGAQNLAPDRSLHLTGKATLKKVIEAYECRREPAGLPVTWKILMLSAWR